MKKWSLYLSGAVLWIAATTMFTSCLEGGKNMVSDGTIGVVRFDSKTFKNVLDVPGQASFYSPAFESMQEGACCYILFEIDLNAPENDAAFLQANGYYTVTVTYKEEFDKYTVSPGILTDTTRMLANETAILDPKLGNLGYFNGILFLVHQLKKPSDQRTGWDLSYDAQNMMKDEYGRHVYNVYLRATVKIPGTKSSENLSEPCAYDIKYFMETSAQKEKNAGSSVFYIRFNYVSEINGEVLAWKSSDLEANVNNILPTTNN